jgi:hypothetical protein
VGGIVVEDSLGDVGSGSLGDGYCFVGAEGVEDMDVIGPGDGVERSGRSCCSFLVRMRMEIIWSL